MLDKKIDDLEEDVQLGFKTLQEKNPRENVRSTDDEFQQEIKGLKRRVTSLETGTKKVGTLKVICDSGNCSHFEGGHDSNGITMRSSNCYLVPISNRITTHFSSIIY